MQLQSLPGVVLDGKYRIEQQLGQGGMGAVFVATHLGTTRTVAVKVIVPQLAAQDEFLLRFQREAEAAGRLRHPNVVNVTDFGITALGAEPLAYLVMEFLDGETLAAYIKKNPQPPVELILDIVDQVALGLDVAHEAGIVHRDLKPDNIWLESNRRGGYNIKVLDFGIAKLNNPSALGTVRPPIVTSSKTEVAATLAPELETQVMMAEAAMVEDKSEAQTVATNPDSSQSGSLRVTASTLQTTVGSVLGTPAFMAPEQSQGTVVNHQADIYSLAVIAYQLFCRRLPFEAKSMRELLDMQISATPPAPRDLDASIPPGVSSTILKGLAKDPHARQPTAGTFAAQLRAAAEGEISFLANGKTFASNHLSSFVALLAVLVILLIPVQTALTLLVSAIIQAKALPMSIVLVAFHAIGLFLLVFISQTYKAGCTMIFEDAAAIGYFRPNLRSNLGRLWHGLGAMLSMYFNTAFRVSRRSFLEAALWPAVWAAEGLSGQAALDRSRVLASTQPAATAALAARQYGLMLMATLMAPTLIVMINGGYSDYSSLLLHRTTLSRLLNTYSLLGVMMLLSFGTAFDFLYRSTRRCLGETVVWSLPSDSRENRKRSSPIRPGTILWLLPSVVMIMTLIYHAFPNKATDSGLIDAASDGRSAAVRKAINAGAPVDSKDQRERTPLIQAALHGDLEGMRLLLDRGANINARMNNGTSALMSALANRRPEAASLLLERKPDVGIVDGEGRTALIYAAMHGYTEICRQLLHQGADPINRDKLGKTALDYAKEEGFKDVVSLF